MGYLGLCDATVKPISIIILDLTKEIDPEWTGRFYVDDAGTTADSIAH